MLSSPIPLNIQIVPPTKNIHSAPGFVKTLEHGCCRGAANLNLLNHPIPRLFGVDDELIPNTILDVRLVPLFMIEHFVIMLDPDGPKRNAPKEVPSFNLFAVFIGNPFSNQCLLSIEAIIIASSNPAKFMHNRHGPFPRPPYLNATP
jgi:hypothetical protein